MSSLRAPKLELRVPENPAKLSAQFQALFPEGVAAATLKGGGDAALLLPAEREGLKRAVPKRVAEFAAGRLCARRALEEFGIENFALRSAPDRQPLWPSWVVGSITHTDGHCAAVAAPRWRFLGLGLDSEIIADVRPALWAVICVARETAWIKSLPAAHQTAAGALIFAAKEAFYKCQYPLVGERLGFHDLCIEAPAFGSWQGSFTVSATREIAVANRAALPLAGRYRFHDALVSAGVALVA